MSVLKLTNRCISQILKICKPNEMLRITINAGGCNGFSYSYGVDNKINKGDIISEKKLARVVVDDTSLDFLKGAVVDYNNELIRSGFIITSNPNTDTSCGCKISFSVK